VQVNTRQTVLIVDDAVANIEILNGILSPDFDVLFATGGTDALEIAKNQNPDMILLDVVMPEMDGYQVCAMLKGDEKTRDIPVIFVTGMDQESDESKGLNVGGVDYIAKPIRPSIVRARIRNHLELKRYRDHLKELSMLDGLTGIANRRRFDEVLDLEWIRARRAQSWLSLIMMDIDHFKGYNDHYGHLSGDECLRRVARGLAEMVRRSADVLARYGGEEFVLLLPDTPEKGAIKVAEIAQAKIASLEIPFTYSPVSDRVTLSMGVAAMVPADNCTRFDLISSADSRLYAAKRNGRNLIQAGEGNKPAK
jgi:diguanylate cyclase (GGDEF)-like protein